MSRIDEQNDLEDWKAKCERASLIELGHLVFTSQGERHKIAEEIALRRLNDELRGKR